MFNKSKNFIKSWWNKLTVPVSENEDESRREYMIKVFMLVICLVVVITSITFFIVYGSKISIDFYVSSLITSIFLIFVVYLNYRGFWRISLYLPSIAFAILSIMGIYKYGYDRMNLMELTIFVFLTSIFLKKRFQYIAILISVSVVGYSCWIDYPGNYDNLIWEVISHTGYFFIIIGIMAFFSGQFQLSLDRARYLQDFFHSTLRSLPGLFYVFDKKGKLTQWNDNLEAVTGYSSKELVKLEPSDLFVITSGKENGELKKFLFKKRLKTVESVVVTKGKSSIPHLITGLRTEISGEEYMIGEGIDITEQKEAEAKAKSLDEIRKNFIRVVSHQLRTPLTVIRWTMDSLSNENFGKLNRNQKEFVRQSANASSMVVGRINDLLTTLEIEEQKTFLRKENFSLADLWSNVSGRVSEICKRKKLKFIQEVDKDLPIVNVDKARIENAMWQLANNGANYTKDGQVKISISKIDDVVRFMVEDTGIGIPDDSKSKLFTKFTRGSNAETVFEDASGIGLYITKFFIEQHGGKVGYETELGKGSKFWFDLPIR